MSFRTGQTVTISHFETIGEGDLAERKLVGTEEAEVRGVVSRTDSKYAGMVYVRPFGADDLIMVHIKNMVAA